MSATKGVTIRGRGGGRCSVPRMPNAHHVSTERTAPAPRALSVGVAATMAGVSANTIRRRIADGTIRAVRLGARVLVPVSELERVLSPLAAAR